MTVEGRWPADRARSGPAEASCRRALCAHTSASARARPGRRGGPDAGRAPLAVEATADRSPPHAHAVLRRRFTFAMRVSCNAPMAAAVGRRVFSFWHRRPSATRRAPLAGAQAKPAAPASSGYKPPPALAVPDTMRPFLEQVQPGKDAFPLEGGGCGARGAARRVVGRTSRRAGARRRRDGQPAHPGVSRRTAAPPGDEPASNQSPLQVQRAAALPTDATLDARAFGGEVLRLTGDLRDITTRRVPDLPRSWPMARTCPPARLRTTVRYDLVGSGTTMHRVEHVGEWELTWQRTGSPVADRPLDRALPRGQPRQTANLRGNHGCGARRQRVVRASARHRPRPLDGDDRLGADP